MPCKIKVLQAKGHSARTKLVYGMLSLGIFSMVFVPLNDAYASVFTRSAEAQGLTGTVVSPVLNSQNSPAALASNIGPNMLTPDKKASDDVVISDAALAPVMGPAGNAADAEDLADTGGDISFYTVQSGDTISSVAKLFDISEGTLRSANQLKAGEKLKSGTILVILPVSGVQYTVKKGDTVSSIAKKFAADANDITYYNGLDTKVGLTVGDTIIVPNGTSVTGDSTPAAPATKPSSSTTKPTTTPTKKPVPVTSGSAPVTADGLYTTTKNGKNNTPITVHPAKLGTTLDLSDELGLPIDPSVGRLSQGIHPYNAVDIAAPLGTPIHAIADGTVLLARTGGYNGGFGNYVILLSVIDGHEVETIYGHQSQVLVTVGQTVSQGDTIGLVGKTGDATGYHLHVEVRGAKNPFVSQYRRQ